MDDSATAAESPGTPAKTASVSGIKAVIANPNTENAVQELLCSESPSRKAAPRKASSIIPAATRPP